MADYGAIIGIISQVAGSAASQAASQMDKDAAMKLIQDSTDAYGRIQVPKLQKLLLEQQGQTGLAGIKDDPRYRDQQNAADAQMDDVIRGGGLTLADKATLNALRSRTARAESAGRNAIMGGMAARGTLDSGAQLAEQLQGNQQSANTLAAGDEAAAGQAQARAYQAIRDRAAMASQGLDRSYRQQSDAARAQDAINAGNVAIMNTAAKYNAGIPQQDFHNQLDLANSQSSANTHLAAAVAGRAKDTQQNMEGMGNMVGAAAKSYGKGATGSSGDYSGSNDNLPSGSTVDNSFAQANEGQFEPYPGSSEGELRGDSTRPEDDEENRLRYGKPRGSNF